MKARAALALALLTACAAVAYQIDTARRPPVPASLTGYLPQDALLTIESPDFASLLGRWTHSAESKSWLASDNYAVFENSRLFGRLGDAQTSFAKAAGVPAGVDLLSQVAGKESVFAWYDIGKLEFLYITRMPAAQADQSQLLQSRGSFERRHAGNADFYIRTSGEDYSTVAFARISGGSGDLVLLATREDLIANALKLIAAASPADSIQQEPWFRDVSAALPAEGTAPSLHMVLNLDRIAVDPHFQTYWVQRNITWTRQFRAAAADLYVESGRFREERVLLPKNAAAEFATPSATPGLALLAALPPSSTGVYRVAATQDASAAVAAIQEKLLGLAARPPSNSEDAPDPELTTPQTGPASDLDTRIDTPLPASGAPLDNGLRQLIRSAGLDAVLTLSSAEGPGGQDSLWVPVHSAVVLRTARAADPGALASALQQTLRGPLTAADIGTSFQATAVAGTSVYALTGPRPLCFAVASAAAQGNLVLLADDRALLAELLHNLSAQPGEATPSDATSIAVFNHASQRAPYIRLTALIDGPQRADGAAEGPAASRPGRATAAPAFFSGNIRSLSDTFAALQSERVVERSAGANLRQTVTYTWQVK
jgi:hypothetical protein